MTTDELRNSIKRKTIHFDIALTLERPYSELKKLHKEIKMLQELFDTAEQFEKRSKQPK